MAVAVSTPTNQRIEVRTKLSPKGWREAGEKRIKRRKWGGGVREREKGREDGTFPNHQRGTHRGLEH